MHIQFIINGFVDFDPGCRLRVGHRDYVVLQFSIERFDDAGRTYHKYDVEIGRLEQYGHFDTGTLAVDCDNDKRVMSWRTSGIGLFDVESRRGTPHNHDLSEFESAVRERAPEFVKNYYEMVQARIRAEVEAMDWPEVIGD